MKPFKIKTPVYRTQFDCVELDLLGASIVRPSLKADILTLDDRLFVKYKGFFNKIVQWHNGEIPDFSKEENELFVKIQSPDWEIFCPNKSDKMIEQLKLNYIQHNITEKLITDEEDLTTLVQKINSIKDRESETLLEAIDKVLLDQKEGKVRGVPFGISQIDECTIGMKPGHFIIIGGYTSTGKTQFSLEIVRRVAKQHPVFFYSLEMTQQDIVARLLKMEEKADDVKNLKLKIFENKTKLEQIEMHLTSQQHRPKIVFVDFIQNIDTDDKSEYERLSNVARRLQQIALKEKICIVALSQVSNESANNNTKTIGFKGSGALAAACDVGIELARDKNEIGDIVNLECKIKKNRHGRTKDIMFQFDAISNKIIFQPPQITPEDIMEI